MGRDFFAVGFGNVVGGAFGALPAMCGFSRSAINYSSGASSQISLFVSAIAAVVFMLTITPALYYLFERKRAAQPASEDADDAVDGAVGGGLEPQPA